MTRLLSRLLMLSLSTLAAFLVFEGILRAFPSLISEPVLMEFPRGLRSEIAIRLDLPVKQARRCISPQERYDGGPELCISRPDFEWVQRADPVDRDYGAQEHILQDRHGFCNTAAVAAREQHDIVFLGDSFAWCTSVQPGSTYAALVGGSTGYPVYNLGSPGIGLYEYVELLKRFGLAHNPRIAVMAVYEGNDLRDGVRYWKFLQEIAASPSATSDTDRKENDDSGFMQSIFDRSYSLGYISAFFESTAKRLLREEINFRYSVSVQGRKVAMNPLNADMDEVINARRLRAGDISPAVWDSALVEFSGLAGENGFTPLVIYIPSAYTAYSRSVVFEDPRVGVVLREQSLRQREYLAELSARLGIPFVDLTDELVNAVADSSLAYFPANVHLTEAGHALIAELLVPRVRSLIGAGKAAE